jgi:hypothetical protein
VIQTAKLGARIMRYELADYEWVAIKPMLPNKPRGVPRVNDRRVLNRIFWAILLASATAATLVGRRSINRPSQGRFCVPCLRA